MGWTTFLVLGFVTPGTIFVLWTNFLVVAFIGSCAIFVVVRPNSAAPMGSPKVCLDEKATWIFEACGHQCICKACARKQKERVTTAASAKKRGKRRAPPPIVLGPLCRCETKVVPSSRHEGDNVYQ